MKKRKLKRLIKQLEKMAAEQRYAWACPKCRKGYKLTLAEYGKNQDCPACKVPLRQPIAFF